QRARQIIERGGMKLGQVADQYHDTVPKGYICSQYPEPGQSFTRAEPISLIVSKGPQPSAKEAEPNELPPPPQRDVPQTIEESGSPITTENKVSPTVALVSRTVAVRVAIPADGDAQEVRIDVVDKDGERNVYRHTHSPGDLVDEAIRVTREQGTKATVRIYVDGVLLREQTA
ncbi:MAG TPA: PASTA domain-containing protein, partial [Abditibacteriaceae bacterium]